MGDFNKELREANEELNRKNGVNETEVEKQRKKKV